MLSQSVSHRYAEINVSDVSPSNFTGGGINYVVQTLSGVLYLISLDASAAIVWMKSDDGGFSWSAPVTVHASTATALAIWYDRWSGIAADLIHIAYSESTTDDTLYRNLDCSSDTLSSVTSIFAGASTLAGGSLSITRARGGNIYCRTNIDAGTEGGFFRSTDTGGTWASRTVNEALATTDQMILLPGWAADNQDIIGIFWDASAEEISRQLYDDSANSWAETSIAATMTDTTMANSGPHFAAAVDLTNSRNVLVAWSAVDTANADLRCWTITEAAITEVTNVVLNSTDDQGLAAIAIGNGHWYVYYAGKSDGSETFPTSVHVYYKYSADGGTTWSAETQISHELVALKQMYCTPRYVNVPIPAYFHDLGVDRIRVIVPYLRRRSSFQVGI